MTVHTERFPARRRMAVIMAGAVASLLLAGLLGTRPAWAADQERVARGAYLFHAADCAACHENPVTHALTGGRGFDLPFGTVHATNITPDKETGIGAYDDATWLRMMRGGVARDGRHLYPVMPYTAYALMRDDDAIAIRAYLMTLPAERAPAPGNTLRFPFNQRWGMIFWNWLEKPSHAMEARADRSAEWNRGAYLAEALGHCAQCHTPRNVIYGLSSRSYAGAVAQGWRAYNLTADRTHGLGGWSDDALASYLSTGAAAGHGPASGPMAEAVSDSLRFLTPQDIHALVVYLREIPARDDGPPATHSSGHPGNAEGARLFAGACAGCHLPDGAGRQSAWSALAGAHSLSDPEETNLRQALANGTAIATATGLVAMPGFHGFFTPPETDALLAYLRTLPNR